MQVGSEGSELCACGYSDQSVPELRRSRVPNPRLVLSSHHGGNSLPSRGFVPVLGQDDRVKALLRWAPDQVGKIAPHGVEPRSLPCQVPVVPLVDATGPSSNIVCLHPPTGAGGLPKSERIPSVGVHRMLKDSSPFTNGVQCRSEASSIISHPELVWLSWRAMPEPSPPLARRVGDDRERAGVLAGIAGLRPGIDARDRVTSAIFNKKSCNHLGSNKKPNRDIPLLVELSAKTPRG